MDGAGRPQAASPARRARQPRATRHPPAGCSPPLGLSPNRALARPDLARASAGQAQGVADRDGRWSSLDLCRAADDRRDRAAAEKPVRLLLFALLLAGAGAHLLLPPGPLREG